MRLFSRSRDHRYCAFCKSKREIYVKKHVDVTNVVLTLGLAIASSSAVWGWLDPRALALWPILLSGSEVFTYVRWRISIVCTLCGFDPVLYKRDRKSAALKVNEFYKEKIKEPGFLLTRSPLVEIYRKHQQQQQKLAQYAFVAKKNADKQAEKVASLKSQASAQKPLPKRGGVVSRTI